MKNYAKKILLLRELELLADGEMIPIHAGID